MFFIGHDIKCSLQGIETNVLCRTWGKHRAWNKVFFVGNDKKNLYRAKTYSLQSKNIFFIGHQTIICMKVNILYRVWNHMLFIENDQNVLYRAWFHMFFIGHDGTCCVTMMEFDFDVFHGKCNIHVVKHI